MANNKVEKPNLTGDFVLADLIDKICHGLYLRDLCRIARVCKSWNAAVKRELQRRGMQRINLYENQYNLQFRYQFKVKPHIVLMFATHREFNEPDHSNPYPTVSYEYLKKYVDTTVLLGNSRLYTERNFNTEFNTYDEDKCLNYLSPTEIPCLIIPKHNKLDVKFVCLSSKEIQKKSFNHKTAINPLLPKEKQAKTFLMLFTCGCKKAFLKKSFNYMKECFQGHSYALWGSESFFPPFVNNSKNGCTLAHNEKIGFVGISITSANIDLFSAVFSCEKMKISTFYQDLVEFKEKVKLKRHSMAFITGPWYEDYCAKNPSKEVQLYIYEDEFYDVDYEKEYLYHFKKVFPDVPFISAIQNCIFKIFGNDPSLNKFLMHDEAISIVIVTYN